jgi:branched-chain amino acid transport system ATP-binding protein
MTRLLVQNLSKSFDGEPAVREVSFSVAVGERLAMIGPNGAGKSTCFNMIGGQLAPDQGRVLLDGREVTRLTPHVIWRKGVGRTFQVAATFASMTVAENVQMALMSRHHRLLGLFARAHSLYRDEALGLLERVGMADQAGRQCGLLAYGDVKRVELAMALANEPRLLLMDEPTAGMAPRERHALMDLTSKVVAEGNLALLFTEHDMDIVFTHADRIIVLMQGSVIADGPPEQVRANPEVQAAYLGGGDLDAMGSPR